MTKDEETTYAILGMAIAIPALLIVSSIVDGWVLTKLWAWFIVPTFGVQPIGIAMAYGLSITVHFLTHQINWCKEEKPTMSQVFGVVIGRPGIVLGVAYITHLCTAL